MILPTKLKIDLLIFDFDGTLANSLPAAIASIKALLKELGLPPKTTAQINKFIGPGEAALVAGSIGSHDPKLIKQAQAIYYKHVRQRIPTVPLFPAVKEFLEYFKTKPKVVVSNKRDEFIKLILDCHDLTNYFADILGGDTSECLKPNPCTINKLIKRYNVPPERTLFIGDMTIDIETGKNAHAHTCAVTYGLDSRKKLAAHKPDFLVDDLLKLKDLIF